MRISTDSNLPPSIVNKQHQQLLSKFRYSTDNVGVADIGVVAISHDPRLREMSRQKVPKPHHLAGCPSVECMAVKPMHGDYAVDGAYSACVKCWLRNLGLVLNGIIIISGQHRQVQEGIVDQ